MPHEYLTFADVMAAFDAAYTRMWVIVAAVLLIGLVLWRGQSNNPIASKSRFALPPRLTWPLLYFVALLLRVPLMFRSFWYDEAFTNAMVKANNFGVALAGDVHPPLHYLIVKAFTSVLGDNEIVLRLPSLIAGLLLIYIVYRIVLALGIGQITAWTSALLVAVLPSMAYYSAEARYPMLLALAVCVGVWAILEQRRVLLAIALMCIPMLHATGIIFAGSMGLVILYSRRRIMIEILVAAPFTIFSIVLAGYQSQDIANGFWLPLVHPLLHIVEGTITLKNSSGPLAIFMMITIMTVTLMGLWVSRQWLKEERGQLVLVIMCVPLVLWLISVVWHPVYIQRAVIGSTVMLIITWASALPRLHKGIQLAFWVAIGLAIVTSQYSYLLNSKMSLRDVYQKCSGSNWTYATSTHMSINALAYAPSPVRVWQHGDNLGQELSDEAKEALGMMLVGQADKLPTGVICLVAMYEAHTLPTEVAHIKHIIQTEKIISDEWIDISALMSYRIVRFYHE